MNEKEYSLLADFICTRFAECGDCPLKNYADCDSGVPERKVMSFAKRLRHHEKKDDLCLVGDEEEKEAREVIDRYSNGTIV